LALLQKYITTHGPTNVKFIDLVPYHKHLHRRFYMLMNQAIEQ